MRESRLHGTCILTTHRHREYGAVFFHRLGIVDAAGLGEAIESRAVAGRNDVVFRKSACGRPVEGDHPFVTQIRRPQAKERAVVVVATDGGGAVEPLAHLHQRAEGLFTVAGRAEGMDDGEIGTVGAQAKKHALAVLPAELRCAVVVAAGRAEESVVIGVAVVAGVLGEDVEYLVLLGREIVAENHTGALAAIR